MNYLELLNPLIERTKELYMANNDTHDNTGNFVLHDPSPTPLIPIPAPTPNRRPTYAEGTLNIGIDPAFIKEKKKEVKRETIIRFNFPDINSAVEIHSDGHINIGCNHLTPKESKMLLQDLAKVHGFKLTKK